MQEIERVLVHPSLLGDFPDKEQQWAKWLAQPTTREIPVNDYEGLADTSYLEVKDEQTSEYLVKDQLFVGGKVGPVCVKTHLIALAQHPRVISGEVRLFLDLSATLARDRDRLNAILETIQQEYGVVINLVE